MNILHQSTTMTDPRRHNAAILHNALTLLKELDPAGLRSAGRTDIAIARMRLGRVKQVCERIAREGEG